MHKFRSTTIEHHADGSATIHHEHEDGVSHVHHAVLDLDGVHDSLEDNLRDPEEIEAFLKEHGIDPEKLEEAIEPGLHDKALDALAEKHGVDPNDVEEEVSPGIHAKLAEVAKKD